MVEGDDDGQEDEKGVVIALRLVPGPNRKGIIGVVLVREGQIVDHEGVSQIAADVLQSLNQSA